MSKTTDFIEDTLAKATRILTGIINMCAAGMTDSAEMLAFKRKIIDFIKKEMDKKNVH